MSLLQAFLCGIVYFLGGTASPLPLQWTLMRPLANGFVVGLILGDPLTGAMVGASINLIYLGFITAGGSMPSDPVLAGVLGTALAITGGLDTNAAIAVAVPLGLIGTVLWYLHMTLDTIFVHMSDKLIDKGQIDKLWITNILLPWLLSLCLYAIPCTLAAYFGSAYIQNLVDLLSGKVLSVLSIIGGLMPAIGISVTLQYIYKGETKVFLFLGFIIAALSGVSLLALGILGLIVAIIYVQVKGGKKEA